MRAIAPSPDLLRGASKAPRGSVCASKKSNASSDLEKEDGAFTKLPPPEAPILPDASVCQDGTTTPDPNRDGPRLMPVFVAQLLGQLMEDRTARPPSAAMAYEIAKPRIARLFDRKS